MQKSRFCDGGYWVAGISGRAARRSVARNGMQSTKSLRLLQGPICAGKRQSHLRFRLDHFRCGFAARRRPEQEAFSRARLQDQRTVQTACSAPAKRSLAAVGEAFRPFTVTDAKSS